MDKIELQARIDNLKTVIELMSIDDRPRFKECVKTIELIHLYLTMKDLKEFWDTAYNMTKKSNDYDYSITHEKSYYSSN